MKQSVTHSFGPQILMQRTDRFFFMVFRRAAFLTVFLIIFFTDFFVRNAPFFAMMFREFFFTALFVTPTLPSPAYTFILFPPKAAWMRKKVYGQSRDTPCLFCGGKATTKNTQLVPVCRHHRQNETTLRCSCGEYLDVKESKYGTFFLCFHCGPVSYNKGLEMNNLPLRSMDEL